MQIVALYLSTALVFLGVDAVMVTYVMQPLFAAHLGEMLRDKVNLAPAALFYLAYVAGLLYFVSWPVLRGRGSRLVLPAAILGAMAYGTYEFTNLATLRGWHWSMVAADVTWGAVLTAFSAWAGVAITRAIMPRPVG